MRRVSIYIASMIGAVAASNSANAQQAVVLKATGVSDCAIGLPTPGMTGSPIAIATDVNGHLCLSGSSQSFSSFAATYPSFGTAIGVKDVTGTNMTYLRADGSNNLYTVLAGSLPAFASPPSVAQSGAWNVGLTGTLPSFAAVPAFKIDQTNPGTSNLVQIGGALPNFANPPSVTQSGTWNVGLTGTLPSFAAVPTFKIDQTNPGTTNLVQIGGALPNFADPPSVVQSGTWNVGLTGPLPAFATPPAVAQSGAWHVGSEGVVYIGPLGSAATYTGTSTAAKAIGGLQTLAVFRSDGGGGILSHIGAMFDAGQTSSVTVFLFRANPTASTCIDNTTFVLDPADRTKLIFQPITISPQDVVGITESYDGLSVGISVKNADGPPTQNLYACSVTSSSLALSGAGFRLAIGVDQN